MKVCQRQGRGFKSQGWEMQSAVNSSAGEIKNKSQIKRWPKDIIDLLKKKSFGHSP